MGIVRLFLALVVVLGHYEYYFREAGGIRFPSALTFGMNDGMAVMFFYIVSGFLISYVIENKYPPTVAGTFGFYKSRFVRIYSLW